MTGTSGMIMNFGQRHTENNHNTHTHTHGDTHTERSHIKLPQVKEELSYKKLEETKEGSSLEP